MASTYTLNNGIELIGTGEQSGTWGDTTNENLQFIDTALDGQVTITATSAGTSGSPNTLPIADGQSINSEGRNRMVIITSATDLGSTVYYQLTPNDAEKIIYIRNDLNAQDLILFQGTYNSSNDYVVPNGTTAVIYFDGNGSGAVAANVFNNAYFDSLRLGSVSVTAILDEDDMSSDSATALATQQSIKAYVDTQITAEDLDFGGDSGTGAVDLDSQTFTIAGTANEIETSASGQTLTVGLPDNVTIAGDLTVDTDTLYVDSTNNRVGIGTASPQYLGHFVDGDVAIVDTDATNNAEKQSLLFGGAAGETAGLAAITGYRGSNATFGELIIKTADTGTLTEAMRIDSSQRVLIGGQSDTLSVGGIAALLQVENTSGSAAISIARHTASVNSGYLNFGKSRGADATIVQENDYTGFIQWAGADGTDINSYTAYISSAVDGTPGANDMPGRLMFWTTADGASAPTERMRISSSGNVGIASGGDVSLDSTDIVLQIGSGSYSNPTIQIRSSSSGTGQLWFGDNSGSDAGRYDGFIQYNQTDRFMYFGTAQSNALRIDSNQRTIIGGYSHIPIINASVQASVVGGTADSGSGGLGIARFGGPPVVALASSPNTTVGSFTLTSDGTAMGYLYYGADDGTDIRTAGAYIGALVDGTPGSNDMPGRIVFATTADGASSPTERMRISQKGYVGIGTSGDPLRRLTVKSTDGTNQVGRFESTESAAWVQFASGSTGTASRIGSPDNTTSASVAFVTADVERMRVNPDGHVLIGHTSAITHQGEDHELQVSDTNFSLASFATYRNGSDGAMLALSHSRNTTKGSQTILNADDNMGGITFFGSDGTDFARGAQIRALVDGTPGNNDMPGRIIFSTSSDGTDSPTERMRIDKDGRVFVGTTTANQYGNTNTANCGSVVGESGFFSASRDGNSLLFLNRLSSNGKIAEFAYNGADAGGMGVRGGMLRIGNGDVGLEFHDNDNTIYSADLDGSSLPNGTTSLGDYPYQFKRLYLSSGVYYNNAKVGTHVKTGSNTVSFTLSCNPQASLWRHGYILITCAGGDNASTNADTIYALYNCEADLTNSYPTSLTFKDSIGDAIANFSVSISAGVLTIADAGSSWDNMICRIEFGMFTGNVGIS